MFEACVHAFCVFLHDSAHLGAVFCITCVSLVQNDTWSKLMFQLFPNRQVCIFEINVIGVFKIVKQNKRRNCYI